MSTEPLIDTNIVLGPLAGPGEPAPVADALAMMGRFGIGTALVRHAEAISYDAAAGNQALLDAIRDEPRLIPAFVVGPLDCGEHGGPTGLRDHLYRHGVCAVWLYPRSHGWAVTGPEARTLLAELATAGLPVFVDLAECSWDEVAVLAARLPQSSIVVAGVGYRTLRQAVAVLAAHDNVLVETGFLAAHRGLEELAGRFGAGRLCFATGYPHNDPAGSVHLLHLADITAADRAQVGTGTARRLLRTEPHPAEAAAAAGSAPAGGIVDAHAHIGLWPSSYLPAPDVEDLVASMDRTATSVSIVSAMRALWSGEVRSGNGEAIAAARRFPGRVYVHAVANPHRREDHGYLLDLLARDEVRGLKIHPHTHDCAVDDPRYDWVFELAAAAQVPVLGHCFEGTWHSSPAGFGAVAARYPELILVAGHAGATPAGFRAIIATAVERPNLYAELCGSQMTSGWIRRLVEELGVERILHGTDATLIDPRIGVGRVLYADLKDEERAAVLALNARRLYRLTDDDGSRAVDD